MGKLSSICDDVDDTGVIITKHQIYIRRERAMLSEKEPPN
jgi:hypothetical protein